MKTFRQLPKKHQIIIITIIFIFCLALIYSAFILISRIGKVSTTIQYAPTSATIRINGEEVKNKSTKYLQPGDYTVEVEYPHFDSIQTTVTISKDLHYIAGVLTPNDEEGEHYHNAHQNEFIEAEGIVSQYFNTLGSLEKQHYPILKYLPINNNLYSLSYYFAEDHTTPIIVVKTTTLYLDDAVSKLKTFTDVDLESYQIIFKLNNPFESSPKTTTSPTKLFNNTNYTSTKLQTINDDYSAILLYIDDYDRAYQYAHYRALFKKVSTDEWELVATPQPLLTQSNTPNVDHQVLKAVNALSVSD